ncbi:MAG: ferredoxin family protein [Promethearchaeota archaeon]
MVTIPFINNTPKAELYGIPRNEINWIPKVDNGKCIGCGLCVLECPTHVFRFDFKRHVSEIIEVSKCEIGCTICANLCLFEAIKLPPLSELYKLMKEKNIIDLSWKNLDYNKYMWI